MKRIALRLVVLLVVLIGCIPSSQFPDVGLPSMFGDPLGLNAPSITTSFNDTSNDAPLADSFEPAKYEPLVNLPRGPNGGFLLRPGAFEMVVESYCLHAGTYGPSRGDGYLYAPLKGQASGIIRNILRRSVQHEEIAQHDIQVLLWAILARAKLSDMAPATQLAAAVLLTPKELLQLNGGVLSLIPAEMLQGLLAELPEPVRATVRAESQLREMLSQAEASYEALERVAVLSGAAPLEGVVAEVPRGRWSRHPGGFFVRYLPTSYSQTLIQLFVPPNFLGSEGDFKGNVGNIGGNKLPSRPTSYSQNRLPFFVPAGFISPGSSYTGGGGETGGGGAGGSYEYNPSGDVGVPGNTSSQRLGLSPRPYSGGGGSSGGGGASSSFDDESSSEPDDQQQPDQNDQQQPDQNDQPQPNQNNSSSDEQEGDPEGKEDSSNPDDQPPPDQDNSDSGQQAGNTGENDVEGDEPGQLSEPDKKPTRARKMQDEVDKGQAPKTIRRVDSGHFPGENDHVHFKKGDENIALYNNGKWKHDQKRLTAAEKRWLLKHNWTLPPDQQDVSLEIKTAYASLQTFRNL